MPGVGQLPFKFCRKDLIMKNWQVLTFEISADLQTPITHPPLIQAALDVFPPNGSVDFCVLERLWYEGNKMFRDYYFSPEAIIICGSILIHHPGKLCERPSGSELNLVAGPCTSFIAESRGAS
jgi:hypothetical protein